MDFFKGKGKRYLTLYYVVGESEENVWLAKLIQANNGAVTVIDPRYSGGELRDGINYTNMKIAQTTFDIPEKIYFYSYMDPMNRKF